MNKTAPTLYGSNAKGVFDFYSGEREKFGMFIDSFENGTEFEVTIKKRVDKRTTTQNNALHKYFELVAEALNEAGLTIEKVIKNFTMEHEWSAGAVKEILWREAQRFATQKESTTELDKTKEIDAVWEIVNRFLAKLKVESIPFPSMENTELKVGEDKLN